MLSLSRHLMEQQEMRQNRFAEIKSEEERKAIKQYYEKNVVPKIYFFLIVLNLIRGTKDNVKYGWWIGPTDEVEEGRWSWKHSGDYMRYLALKLRIPSCVFKAFSILIAKRPNINFFLLLSIILLKLGCLRPRPSPLPNQG